MTVGGGELRVPAARACCRGGMVLQYSEGTLGFGLGPVGLIMRSRARATGEDKRGTGGGAGCSSGHSFTGVTVQVHFNLPSGFIFLPHFFSWCKTVELLGPK